MVKIWKRANLITYPRWDWEMNFQLYIFKDAAENRHYKISRENRVISYLILAGQKVIAVYKAILLIWHFRCTKTARVLQSIAFKYTVKIPEISGKAPKNDKTIKNTIWGWTSKNTERLDMTLTGTLRHV